MGTQNAVSANSRRLSSGKLGHFSTRRSLPLAAAVARQLGIVQTWPNVQTIRLAIESEAELSGVSPADVVEMLVRAGKEYTRPPQYSCPPEWEVRDIFLQNTVDRFWFEDARWRGKFAYAEFRARLREERGGKTA
jgi:hypothetical protein